MVLPGRGLCLLAETVNCSIELSMVETTIVYPLKRLTAFRDEGYFSLVRALVTFISGNQKSES